MDYFVLHQPYQKNSINKVGELINNKTQKKLSTWISNGYKFFTLRNSDLNKKRNLSLHRLLGMIFINNPNQYPCIDHVDRNKRNNDLNNLRWVSYQTNALNKASKNPLGRGISKSKSGKRYCANLFRNGKKKWIGSFENHEDAISAYKHACKIWEHETHQI